MFLGISCQVQQSPLLTAVPLADWWQFLPFFPLHNLHQILEPGSPCGGINSIVPQETAAAFLRPTLEPT